MITEKQIDLFIVILNNEGHTKHKYSMLVNMTYSHICNLISGFERQGYIKYVIKDKRSKRIYLTLRGRQIAEACAVFKQATKEVERP